MHDPLESGHEQLLSIIAIIISAATYYTGSKKAKMKIEFHFSDEYKQMQSCIVQLCQGEVLLDRSFWRS